MPACELVKFFISVLWKSNKNKKYKILIIIFELLILYVVESVYKKFATYQKEDTHWNAMGKKFTICSSLSPVTLIPQSGSTSGAFRNF